MIYRSNAEQCYAEMLKNFERRMCSQFFSIASGVAPVHRFHGFHSRDVKSSNSRSPRIFSDGSSRISMPGPTDLELRPLGNI